MKRKIFKVVIPLILVVSVFVTTNLQMFAAPTVTTPPTGYSEFISKVEPYVAYDKDKKAYLTTEDLNVLKITKQELTEFKKGLEIGNRAKVTVEEVKTPTTTPSASSNDRFSVSYNATTLTISFTPTDIKILLTVALIAGLALSIAGAIYGTSVVWLIGGFLIYKGVFLACAGAFLGTFAALVTLWWNPTSNLTLQVPIAAIPKKQGKASWQGPNVIGQKQVQTKEWKASPK